MLSLTRPEVRTLEQFEKHRSLLIKKNRLRAPLPNPYSQRRTILQLLRMDKDQYALYAETLSHRPADYTPPSIDAVPAQWLDSRQLDVSLKKQKRAPEQDNTATPEGREAGAKPAKKVFKINRYGD
jgi:hypothetical protein